MTTERLPAALRIAQALQNRIQRHEFQPGEWLPTERELATEFGADRTTVRAAITHLAEQRLIVREPGRRPRINRLPADRAGPEPAVVRPPAIKTIAAIIPQPPDYPALSSIQRGILKVLRQKRSPYRLVAFDNQGEVWSHSVDLERAALRAIESEGIAAAILWSLGGEETLPDIRRLQNKGVPLVLLDRCPADLPCDFVGVDNRTAAREAVNYLLNLGHRRVAHLTSANGIMTVQEREAGFREALQSRGLDVPDELIFRLQDRDDLRPDVAPAVDHFLNLPDPPTALFALKDLLAHAFISEVSARGLRVPEDMSVLGFDDRDRYALQAPVLTTVHQPFESMGQHAVELLLRRIGSQADVAMPNQRLLLPTPLVVRTTCRSIADPDTARSRQTGSNRVASGGSRTGY